MFYRGDSGIFDEDTFFCIPDLTSSYESTVFHCFLSNVLGIIIGLFKYILVSIFIY